MVVIAYQYQDEPWKPLALCIDLSVAHKILAHLKTPHMLAGTKDIHKFCAGRFEWTF